MTTTTAATATRTGLARTERQWLLALAITAALVGLFALFGALERQASSGLDRAARFVWNSSETPTRFLAVAHTLVATSFLLTSKKVRRPRTALGFVACAALGVAACLGFRALGGMDNVIAGFLFYAYFIAHELRDEGYLTGRNGDAGPAAAPGPARWLEWTPALLVVLFLIAVGATGVAFGGAARRLTGQFAVLSPTVRIAGSLLVLVLAILAGRAVLARAARLEQTTILGHLSRRRPRVFVSAGLLFVLLVGAVLTGRVYLIVAVHVVWWAVFSFDGMRRAPRPAVPPRAFSWAWVRTTPRGFVVFHAAVMLVVVGVGAAHALLSQNDPSWAFARLLSGREAFPYWTLMHVSLSWLPRA